MRAPMVYFDGTIDGVRLRVSQTDEDGPNGNVWLERLDAPIERENYHRQSLSLAMLDLLAMWTSARTRKGLGATFRNLSRHQCARIWVCYPEVFEGTEVGASLSAEQVERERRIARERSTT